MSKPRPTLFDYMIVAVNPALVMTLIGSLVYFLLEMFYQGQYPQRLHFCLTMFVFAIVLVSRISMEEGWERAMPFGVALAVVVALAMHRFVNYTGSVTEELGWIINLSLMAITWWCADRLTWDCTLVDESQDASGEGLLQSIGMDEPAEAQENIEPSPAGRGQGEGASPDKKRGTLTPALSQGDREFDDADDLGWTVKKRKSDDGESWWQRFVNRRRRPHAHGLVVVYFSLAALPIFGLGQTLIPATNTGSRRYAFLLLCVYLASALGLLVTTSFLGLRRYLRQRRIEMPALMANTWLAIGAVLIVALLFLVAVLPRPNAEYEISELPLAVRSADQSASQQSVGEEGTKDDQATSGGGKSNDGKADTANSPDGKNEGEKGKGGESKKSGDGGGKSSKDGDAKSGDGKTSSDTDRKSAGGKSDSQGNAQKASQSDTSNQEGAKSDQTASSQPATNPESPQAPSTPPTPDLSEVTSTLSTLGKWIFYGILLGLFLWWLVTHWTDLLVWLSSLANAWRDFWRKLFGGHRVTGGEAEANAARKKSFLDYSDPFAAGIYQRYPAVELIRYTFEAFEAWARDNGCPRGLEQTAYEFARQVAGQAPHLAGPAKTLADLYSRAAYSPGSLPSSTVDHLRTFWQELQRAPVAA